jgi:Ala-tRNA(Pro) deacylase
MIAAKVRSLLERNDVDYSIIHHRPTYTAHETAESAHVKGRDFAKPVIVRIDNWLAMVVVPASRQVSLDELKEVVGTHDVRLAKEHEFAALFPDCEAGAMPPFGNLYGLDVYVDPTLALDDQITFNAGSHTELIRMKYDDFESLAHPKVAIVA